MGWADILGWVVIRGCRLHTCLGERTRLSAVIIQLRSLWVLLPSFAASCPPQQGGDGCGHTSWRWTVDPSGSEWELQSPSRPEPGPLTLLASTLLSSSFTHSIARLLALSPTSGCLPAAVQGAPSQRRHASNGMKPPRRRLGEEGGGGGGAAYARPLRPRKQLNS